nr:DNA-directed RNA polymerase [Methylobacterium sp. ZNC0032]
MTSINQHPLFQAQLDLEEEMRSLGISRFRDQLEEARTEKQETRIQTIRRLLGHHHQAMVAGIEAFMAEAKSGKAGRKHSALKYCEMVGDVDLMAHMTLRVVLDGITSRETLTHVALNIASLLEDEVHFTQFEEQAPDAFKARKKAVEKGGSDARRRRNAMLIPARKQGVELAEWGAREKLLFGQKLVEIMRTTTDLVDIERTFVSTTSSPIYVVATEATAEWIKAANSSAEWLSPTYLPTIIPPKPWTTPFDGGYWSGRVRRLLLVKTRNRQYLEELRNREMPTVYSALNALQETPWSVNKRVLEVMEHLWSTQSDLDFIPRDDKEDAPTRPLWLTPELTKETMTPDQLAQFRDWKKDAADVHARNIKQASRHRTFSRMLSVARKFKDHEEIYFPHNLDWRGRVYPCSLYLTPQGNDAQRGLLQFANSVPLTDEDGVLWLAVHGAGLWGVDKVSLEARRAWVEENEEEILAAARDPFEGRFWMEAEKPWEALAFCFDWLGWKTEGYAFQSQLPVQMDGTCNGLQNFSAILRDEVGGAAVNLVPADKPNDIYSTVAEVVARMVEADLDNTTRILITRVVRNELGKETKEKVEGPMVCELARGWHGHINRKVTKRPVMTLAYGARLYGFKEMVMVDTVSKWKAKGDFPFEGSGWQAADYMGKLIWDAVGEVVKAATGCMDWLQAAARVAASEGMPVLWTTPAGFLVQQAYHLPSEVRIKTHFENIRVRISLPGETQKIDTRKQASGISPNWVHSLDASHMQRTIERCHAMGLRSFCMIHDSYGTHAGNAQVMANALREEFVRMYSEQDVLAKFREDLLEQMPVGTELTELPPKGSLDLSQVLESPFFFA